MVTRNQVTFKDKENNTLDTCFLFTEFLNDTSCLCLKLNTDGLVKNPPTKMHLNEIKALQKDSRTILVESCTQATLIKLELPWLPEHKARAAIPYALEDKLAQPVEELHFAFDKTHYHNNHYLISVITKQRILYLVHQMNKREIEFDLITLDWFALDEDEMCISGTDLLVNQESFKGALSGSLAFNYIKQHSLTPPLLFQDSSIPIVIGTHVEKNPELSHTWIAQKLLKTKPLNLCQGEIQRGTNLDLITKGYKWAAVLCGIWLISILITDTITLSSLNKKTSEIDRQIEVIYHQFFPQAKQIINPKFRISQLLKTSRDENQTHFWLLMNEFSKKIKDNNITLQQLRYQNKTLQVTVVSPDFATLEQFEKALKIQLKVNQTQASTHEQQVIATLELT